MAIIKSITVTDNDNNEIEIFNDNGNIFIGEVTADSLNRFYISIPHPDWLEMKHFIDQQFEQNG